MKTFSPTKQARPWLLACLLLGSAGTALAALGQAPSTPTAGAASSATPAARMLAAKPTNSAYAVHETLLDSGTLVREFATPAGVVFALQWRGPTLPDLNALLGNYIPTFQAVTDEARQAGRRGGPVVMARDGLVVHSNGRMRNFFGDAYAPALIPSGVNIHDVLQ
jgi:hypothetical protein